MLAHPDQPSDDTSKTVPAALRINLHETLRCCPPRDDSVDGSRLLGRACMRNIERPSLQELGPRFALYSSMHGARDGQIHWSGATGLLTWFCKVGEERDDDGDSNVPAPPA